MKTATLLFALVAIASAPAFAAGGDPQETTLDPVQASHEKPISGRRAVNLIALETQLEAPDVLMVMRTEVNHRRYPFRFQRDLSTQFKNALGTERFTTLISGQPIELYSPAVLQAVRGMSGITTTDAATSGLRVAVNP